MTPIKSTIGSYATFRPRQLTAFADFFYIEADDPATHQDVHVGNLLFAGEHLSDAFYGYMNGAAQIGRLAAEFIVRRMQQTALPTSWRGRALPGYAT